jgi:hypothetical protein
MTYQIITMRNARTYESYIYEAIEGFEIDELIKPKIKAAKGDKERMQALYYAVEKLIRNKITVEDLNSM